MKTTLLCKQAIFLKRNGFKAILAIFFLGTLAGTAQTQIGQDIDGDAAFDRAAIVSISNDGSIIAVGASGGDENGAESGRVRVFENTNGTWTQIGQDIDGEDAGDQSGLAISLSGNGEIIAIGAHLNDGNGSASGHVRVFQNVNGNWVQIGQDIDGEAAGDFSGGAVSLSDNGAVLAIGAMNNSGANGVVSGHVRVYNFDGTVWNQIGDDIDGEDEGDRSGTAVSLSSDGNIVAIGSPNSDGISGAISGLVRVYENQNGTWTQLGDNIYGAVQGDIFGSSVSLSANGSILAVGARHNDGNSGNVNNIGRVRVFQLQGNTWTQFGQAISGEVANDNFGLSVTLSDDGLTFASGGIAYDGTRGRVRVFQMQSSTWIQVGNSIDGEELGDRSGGSVSLSSDGMTIAIGGDGNDENGNQSGHVRVFSTTPGSNDTTPPTAVCQNITVQLDASGNATITPAQIDNGSADDSGSFTLSLDTTSFSCADIGSNGVTLTVTDGAGNTATCAAIVTLQDTTAPTVSCPAATVTVGVDANTNQYIVEDFIANSMVTVSDNCDSLVPNISQTPAPGTQLEGGTFTVTITAEDSLGNSANCSFDLFVDTILSVTENQLTAVGLYPNPASRIVNLSNPQGISLDGIAIYDITGRLVQEVNPSQTGEALAIDINALTNGLYMVVLSANTSTITKRLVVSNN